MNSKPEGAVRVLVVDDNMVNRRVAERLLLRLGVAVDAVSNGRDALEAVRKTEYSLVLMDLEMPEMDGYEVARQLRRLTGAGLPIVACSAWAAGDEGGLHRRAGMDDYLSKPLTVESLTALLERWISLR